jgi:NAD(P)H-hydrate epimerase
VVLKGAHTVVAEPNGRTSVLPFATAALARAGTGDVLAGCIVGLRAQGLGAYESAVLGAYLHGLAGVIAGERLKGVDSVLAGDVISSLPDALLRLRG